MARLFFYDGDQPVYVRRRKKKYGFFNFLFDCALVFLTGGLWLIWIFVREMRRPRPKYWY